MGIYLWQKASIEEWEKQNNIGIISAATGTGKTRMALLAAQKLNSKYNGNLKIRILVPFRALLSQWKESAFLAGFKDEDIGFYSSQFKSPPSRKIIIYVINSARHILPEQIIRIQEQNQHVLLIADEMHHYTSKENSSVFNFVYNPQFNINLYAAIGLSATIDKLIIPENTQKALGQVIYKYSVSQAVKDNTITNFCLYNIAIPLDGKEYDEYLALGDKITKAVAILFQTYKSVMKDRNYTLQEKLVMLRRHEDCNFELIDNLSLLLLKRRSVIKKANSRIKCLLSLLKQIKPFKSVIIFTEYIEQAESVYDNIKDICDDYVVMYHSQLSKEARLNALNSFKRGDASVLISCKALDEGLDVPSTEIGIFLSNTECKRQRIQRAGRILRKSDDKEMAKLYYMYANGTIESPEFLDEYSEKTFILNSIYQDISNEPFFCNEYKAIFESIFLNIKDNCTESVLNALLRAYNKGKMKFDFLMDVKQINEKIESSDLIEEKNYWLLMKQMSKKRYKQ